MMSVKFMQPGKIIKKFKSKRGREVVIRTLQASDLDELLRFANGLIDEDTFMMLSGKKITRAEEQKYLKDSLKRIARDEKIHLVAIVHGRLAGSGEVRLFDKRKSHVGEMGISLAKEFRKEGIGSELFRTLIEEAKKLKLKLLYLHCFENNEPAIRLYEKTGFKRAGVVPGMLEYRRKYFGEVTYYLPLAS